MRLLLLPGSFWPQSPPCQSTYTWLSATARERGLDASLVVYPGQGSTDGAELTYDAAVAASVVASRDARPEVLVAFSLGCHVACGLFGARPDVMRSCEEVVFWGPYLGRTYRQRWGQWSAREAEVARHRKTGTFLAPDYFDRHPDLECLAASASPRMRRLRIRLVRGVADELNTIEDLHELARLLVPEGDADRDVGVFEVPGIEHFPLADRTPPDQLRLLADALFSPHQD